MADLFRAGNVQIRQGLFETSAIVVPSDVNGLHITMSRENWPPAGVTIGFGVSVDSGQTWRWSDTLIAPFVATPKVPNVADSPAHLFYAWNPNLESRKANRVMLRTNSPSQFRSDVAVVGEVYVPPGG